MNANYDYRYLSARHEQAAVQRVPLPDGKKIVFRPSRKPFLGLTVAILLAVVVTQVVGLTPVAATSVEQSDSASPVEAAAQADSIEQAQSSSPYHEGGLSMSSGGMNVPK